MWQKRILDPDIIDQALVEQALKENDEVIIQFSDKTYNDKILSELNELCDRYGDNFTIRFYGHHSNRFNCKIVNKIPNVKSLCVDCLLKADHVEAITKLNNLKKLVLGVYELNETEILSAPNFKNLTKLFISDTKTKALNLEYLKVYNQLEYLIVCKHTKNINAIGELKKLNQLSLNSISKVPIGFVNQIPNLKTLRIILGGRENIHELEGSTIEHLDLIWIRGFNNLSNISNFKNLKSLLVEDNIQLPSIHFDQTLTALKDIKILNCKTLASVTGLGSLPALNNLRIFRTNVDFYSFINQPLPPSLKILAFGTWKAKIDKDIKSVLQARGFSDGLEKQR